MWSGLSRPTAHDMEWLGSTFYALFLTCLWSMRALSDFLISYVNGAAHGEATMFLNVRVGNRERAVKKSVSAFFEANVAVCACASLLLRGLKKTLPDRS